MTDNFRDAHIYSVSNLMYAHPHLIFFTMGKGNWEGFITNSSKILFVYNKSSLSLKKRSVAICSWSVNDIQVFTKL